MPVLSLAAQIAGVIIGIVAIVSLMFTIRFERLRRRSDREDRMRTNLERAVIALVFAHAISVMKHKHDERWVTKVFKVLGFPEIPVAVIDAISKYSLFGAAAAIRTEKQTESMRQLLAILGDAPSVSTEETANSALLKFIDLQEQILAEVANPSSFIHRILERPHAGNK